MTEVFVDSNVILDIVTNDPVWRPWSLDHLNGLAIEARFIANDIVFAEVSSRYETLEMVQQLFQQVRLVTEPMPREALFLAGHAFKRYRGQKGESRGILPDFLIGAHAAVSGRTLLTRDRGRFRTYFPKLQLIAP